MVRDGRLSEVGHRLWAGGQQRRRSRGAVGHAPTALFVSPSVRSVSSGPRLLAEIRGL